MLVNASFVWYSELMKRGILLLMLILSGCVYRNPLDRADFRFQTIMVPPYVLSSWYRISEVGQPLTVYVEKPVLDDETRYIAAKDKSINVAYVARPCQYFQTKICEKEMTPAESDKIVLKGIEQLKKKAGTSSVDVKGLK